MKKLLLTLPLMAFSLLLSFAQTPVGANGRLKLVGNQLSNECGTAIQLRGLSTHGIMFHPECYDKSAVESIANDWGADVLRLAVYTESEGGTAGYLDGDQTRWNNWIDNMVEYTKEYGMYVVIDWHILNDGNPNTHSTEARTFFETMSSRYADENHVIYEIANEPNGGTSWGQVKQYAEQIIPVIRANDPEGIILVGNPQWSSDLWAVANDPLSSQYNHNVMYTFHFYANSHYDYDKLRQTAAEIPIFVSEWGTVDASGNGGFNPGSSNTWTGIMDGNNNGGQLISSANWAFVDKDEAASALQPGSCETGEWTNRSSGSGNYIYNYIQGGPNYSQCNAAADDDGDGVTNSNDLCPGTEPGGFVDGDGCLALQGDSDNDGVIDADDLCDNTPSGSNVNIYGCEIYHSFVSNVCEGFNNVQGYARTSFSEDTLANIDIWNRPENGSPVYSATVGGGTLNIEVTNADPDYETQGFSFGEIYRFNGTDYDTTLIPIDIKGNPIVNLDVQFEGNGYSLSDVMFDIQLEDENGMIVNSDATGSVFRELLDVNEWHELSFDFTNGQRESWNEDTCAKYNTPKPSGAACYITGEFDFSRVSKVLMWVNPEAGADWAKEEAFNGTWRIDNFSIGYEGIPDRACDNNRDDDGDGVRIEDDECMNTPPNANVDVNGCALTQLDTDEDGVSDFDDQCPETPENNEVDYKGCAGFEADDDNDGVMNDMDLCPETPADASVDEDGCTVIIGISDEFANSLKIYPIPTSDILTIEQGGEFNKAVITSVSGTVVLSTTINASVETISLSNLSAGAYILTLTGDDATETVIVTVQ